MEAKSEPASSTTQTPSLSGKALREVEYFRRRVGRRYADCSISNFEAVAGSAQQAALTQVIEYIESIRDNIRGGVNLLLMGPPGTGKDHLMAAAASHAIVDGAKLEWTDGAELFGAFRDLIAKNEPEESAIRRWTDPHVLAISDPVPPLGTVTDHQRAMLFRIIDRRYRDMKATWLTLNVASRDEAGDRLAPNIVDRLGHGAVVVRCNWASYRRAPR